MLTANRGAQQPARPGHRSGRRLQVTPSPADPGSGSFRWWVPDPSEVGAWWEIAGRYLSGAGGVEISELRIAPYPPPHGGPDPGRRRSIDSSAIKQIRIAELRSLIAAESARSRDRRRPPPGPPPASPGTGAAAEHWDLYIRIDPAPPPGSAPAPGRAHIALPRSAVPSSRSSPPAPPPGGPPVGSVPSAPAPRPAVAGAPGRRPGRKPTPPQVWAGRAGDAAAAFAAGTGDVYRNLAEQWAVSTETVHSWVQRMRRPPRPADPGSGWLAGRGAGTIAGPRLQDWEARATAGHPPA